MNNEEILKEAQKSKRNDELERRTGLQSTALGSVISILVGLVLLILQYIAKGTINPGFLAIGTCASAAQYLFEGIKLKKIASLIIGIVCSLLTLLFIAVFISQVFAEVWMV